MASVGKLRAAEAALKEVSDGQVLGIGTGSTVAVFIGLLGKRVKEEGLDLICVPTSYQSAYLAVENGLRLSTLDEHPTLDLAVDGTDEIDPNLNLIKGGGAALTKEKVVDSSAKRFVVIADSSKLVERIGKFPLPVEVLPFARAKVMRAIAVMGGEPRLRDGGDRKDGPLVTDNGNFIVDASFKEIIDPRALEIEIKMVPGVVEVGLFVGLAHCAYLGDGAGVRILSRS
ncbi:MAG: ribose-5-phosphate isomerase RpiA [Candidatus Methanosuratincola sp.]|jgi:ribose 5-phosphate isomerase A|uniref:Ribose-5-phosphate isomerase A n=2 Tax=Candidatus Methanosuratincola (ex Vanwonterghem et al. 2016) TaxID=1915412 RepID=A0A7J3V0P3_9CREN|nr:ribose-5-phosphate isomerase RpiA [Candidatus Methanosuratincola sp.]RWX73173.1 MAG: Ribose 5-phosphate isomerase A [Candidatus Methanosuratincola subterraneus]